MNPDGLKRLAFTLALASLGAAQALAADVAAGKRLADQVCSQCHVVGSSGTHGTDAAPPLPALAATHGGDPKFLRAWLMAPHPPMPNPGLSRMQIDDVVAYLETLKPR
jgi:mono/diheme cytochrome c family protein